MTNKILKDFKDFVQEQTNLTVDFRKHVFLENQYAANPQYSYSDAIAVIDCLFLYFDKFNVNYANRFNTSMMIDSLRITRLKEFILNHLESEIEIDVFKAVTTDKPVFEISKEDEYTEGEAKLSKLGGCSDYDDECGLAEYQYDFDVKVINQKGKKQEFHVVFQPEERNNGMKSYNGYELAYGTLYGCDVDESQELLEFCNYDETVTDSMYLIAEKAAKKEYKKLMLLLKSGQISMSNW